MGYTAAKGNVSFAESQTFQSQDFTIVGHEVAPPISVVTRRRAAIGGICTKATGSVSGTLEGWL